MLDGLEVDAARGLSAQEAAERLRRYGPNRLRRAERRSVWAVLGAQFKNVVVVLLIIAAGLAFGFGRLAEGLAICAVILVNGGIGFVSEWRAVRSMEALRRVSTGSARVRRDGRERQITLDRVVPGDIAVLEAGDIVPADARLIEANDLLVDESMLTGESLPVGKTTEPVESDRPLAERANMLFKGTIAVEGSGEAIVVSTGMRTELGRISELTEEAEEEVTPLEQRLNRLGWVLAWVAIGIAVAIGALGLASGRPTLLIVETAIALGVAAIPEGLPIVATIALARGMHLMALRHALVRRLSSVETLGATRVILTDKTGTLTENRMTLHVVATADAEYEVPDRDASEPDEDQASPLVKRAVEIGVLCNNASIDVDGGRRDAQGDPTEVALVEAGLRFGLQRDELLDRKTEVREVAFDPDRMMMATFHEVEGAYEVAVKGAPGRVLEQCTTVAEDADSGGREFDDEQRQSWLDKASELGGRGYRVLALADKRVDDPDAEPYEALRFVGLVGLYDPPREGVIELIRACNRGGIKVVMVTGDHGDTARAIGGKIGLLDPERDEVISGKTLVSPEELTDEDREQILKARVFARVSPEQKLNLVRTFQERGDIVAMTGDGINDAPALKKADIGVAMGRRGTDAAREAAEMVLQDDAFSSIVAAVQQGRIIFRNIRKAVLFMLCTNVAEILAIAAASVADIPLPLRPLQILFLNVFTDVFPALALSVSKGSPRVLERPPRDPREPVLTRAHWLTVAGWGVAVAGCVLASLWLALNVLELSRPAAITTSFVTLGAVKLWFVMNLRDRGTSVLRNDVVRNRWIWAAIVVCVVLLGLAVYLPGLSSVLDTRALGWRAWGVVLALSLVPVVAGQLILGVGRKDKNR